MKSKVGLWIDHRQATVITITEKGEQVKEILSEVEKQPRRSGDSPLQGSYEARQVPADNNRQRNFTGQLNIYYDAVIASIHDADSILIFGPGEAKDELRKRLEESKFSGHITEIETADKMTDRQIAAKTRQHFGT
jgi:hypothetical protein